MDTKRFHRCLLDSQLSIEIVRALRIQPSKEWRIEPRCHRDSIIYLILKGSASANIDGQACLWLPGQVWWLSPGISHQVESNTPGRLEFFVLRWHCGIDDWPQPSICLDHGLSCRSAFEQLLDAWHSPGRFQETRIRCALVNLLATIAEADHQPQLGNGLTSLQRQGCHDLLARQWSHDLRAEDLARHCGLEPAYFRRLFKRSFGCSPRTWLARERIRHAADLIRESGLGVEAAAQACGYASTPAFSRCFKQVMGVPPSAWK